MTGIDGDVLEARLLLPAGTPLSRTTEAVAQVAGGNQPQHAENLAIAGHRAAYHVGKAGDDSFVEGEARDTIQRCGKDGVAVRCITHGRSLSRLVEGG